MAPYEPVEHGEVERYVRQVWDSDIVGSLSELIRIPALSPAFDGDWAAGGHLRAAAEHVRAWFAAREIPGATAEIIELDGRSPVLLLDVPATDGATEQSGGAAGTVLLYGHLDKQPPGGQWSEGLDPWTPVLRDGRLYGRGAADDGYAGYAAVAALEAVRQASGSHARAVVLLETAEESGSPDLPAYLTYLADRLGDVRLVVCLDSGGSDYRRLWLTTSLRGLAQQTVTVRVLHSGQHSGLASGAVPSSFRVVRTLLERIERAETGEITLSELNVTIPEHRRKEAERAVAAVPGAAGGALPLAPGVRLVTSDEVELLLNTTWRPTLSVIGASGLPEPAEAGNVLRAETTLALSFRLPPTADSAAALAAIQRALTTDVPYGAVVELSGGEHADGWDAPAPASWLSAALDGVSDAVFDEPWLGVGLGGSIPFMGMLGKRYPRAQFLVTGALGPDSNAHVPDESLHLDQARRVTQAVAHLLHAHATA
ncbi:M20/M25/M40 family metallo-hydrolase [Haloechinothrix sp. LS1_15]|uniref:M20/M25/M40 family metallo-hydrolase n=1 Tax=Haloechinothrix sp. LS1_15 TaxID=2652248 RepID=UPI002947F1AE|nr:M20/M25/M40 family metallo-hydrolase [Haloechinothrix sp. LS1_15]MDV6011066.1 M20/M25/M40 family metallo-hydrolase [Haloechinothrix sp. LS1_15]